MTVTKQLTDPQNYADIADAIRAKNGSSDTYTPADMPAAIAAIQTGGGGSSLAWQLIAAYNGSNVSNENLAIAAQNAIDITLADFAEAAQYWGLQTSIYSYAFYCRHDIRSVELPSTFRSIGNYAFMYCKNLKTFKAPNLPNLNAGNEFSNCTALETIDFSAVATLSSPSCFAYCSSLVTARFPALTLMNNTYQFRQCTALKTVDMPLLATFNANYCFDSCSSLKNVNMPLVATMNATQAFVSCTSLEEIELPSLTTFGGGTTFFGCTALEKATLGTAETSKGPASIPAQAFSKCTSLTALILPSTVTTTLSNTNAFTNTPIASGTGYIYVPDDLVATYQAATNWATYAAQIKGLSELPA